MVKIAEWDFISTSNTLYDNVSNLTLTLNSSVTNGILPGFTVRNGKATTITVNGSTSYSDDRYHLVSPTHSYKTFSFWFYITGNWTNFSGYLYADGTTYRLIPMNDSSLYFNDYTNQYLLSPLGALGQVGWAHLVLTLNKLTGAVVSYWNGSLLATYSANLSGIGTSSNFAHGINARFGLLQIYNHILTPAEVSNLYQTFIPDATVQNPFTTVSGIVYGETGIPLPGARVGILNHTTNVLDSLGTTDADGIYSANFSTVGDYTLFTTHTGTLGGKSFRLRVNSDRSITGYDK